MPKQLNLKVRPLRSSRFSGATISPIPPGTPIGPRAKPLWLANALTEPAAWRSVPSPRPRVDPLRSMATI